MPDDYTYINTRVRVMRTKLLGGRALDAALAAGSYQEFLRVLSEGDFGGQMRETTSEGAGLPELDHALSQNFFATVQRVVSFADGNAKDEIEALVMKWDLMNLKTLVRGIVGGRSSEDILDGYVACGTLKSTALRTAASSTDLQTAASAISLSRHPLAKAFKKGVAAYGASQRLLDLEVTLDKGYYDYALEVSRDNSMRRYLSKKIDITNALIARNNKDGTPRPELFVAGGRLDNASYVRLLSGDTSAIPDLAGIFEATSLEEAEVIARGALDKAAHRLSVSDSMGVGIILDFLRRKEMEIAKLRLIGRGKYYNLPTDQIRKEIQA